MRLYLFALHINQYRFAVAEGIDTRIAFVATKAAILNTAKRQGWVAFGKHVAVDAHVAGNNVLRHAFGTL